MPIPLKHFGWFSIKFSPYKFQEKIDLNNKKLLLHFYETLWHHIEFKIKKHRLISNDYKENKNRLKVLKCWAF